MKRKRKLFTGDLLSVLDDELKFFLYDCDTDSLLVSGGKIGSKDIMMFVGRYKPRDSSDITVMTMHGVVGNVYGVLLSRIVAVP